MDVTSFVGQSRDFWTNLEIPAAADVCFIDSSFNPPNMAHVKLGKLCQASFPGCHLIFMLGIGNADKPDVSLDDLQTRLDMMKIMIEAEFPSNSKVGWALINQSMFVKKAEVVSQRLPQINPVFALGFDTLIRLSDQKYYTEPVKDVLSSFFGMVRVLTLTRNEDTMTKTPEIGTSASQLEFLQQPTVFTPFMDRIVIHEASGDTNGVSSSVARSSVSNLRANVPMAVADYVVSHNLYGLGDK